MHIQAFSELTRLYADLEAEQRRTGLACSGCGTCCRFDEVDHVLYASELERQYLLAASTPPAQPDRDADAAFARLLETGLRCPYQRDGRCEARDGRTLGCRLHFCRWPDDRDGEAFCETWHGKLKQLHDDLGLEWRYGPLLPLETREKE